MIPPTKKMELVNSLNNVSYTYNGTPHSPNIVYAGEDYEVKDEIVVVSFLPKMQIIGQSLDLYQGQSTNPIYSVYGYGQEEQCIVRAFCRTRNQVHGRLVVYEWMNRIEKYIRSTWNSLLNGSGAIRVNIFVYRDIADFAAEKIYGYEMAFDVISNHMWTDEPESGAISDIEVSGIYISDISASGSTEQEDVWID